MPRSGSKVTEPLNSISPEIPYNKKGPLRAFFVCLTSKNAPYFSNLSFHSKLIDPIPVYGYISGIPDINPPMHY